MSVYWLVRLVILALTVLHYQICSRDLNICAHTYTSSTTKPVDRYIYSYTLSMLLERVHISTIVLLEPYIYINLCAAGAKLYINTCVCVARTVYFLSNTVDLVLLAKF